jgi:hypothetical protein
MTVLKNYYRVGKLVTKLPQSHGGSQVARALRLFGSTQSVLLRERCFVG